MNMLKLVKGIKKNTIFMALMFILLGFIIGSSLFCSCSIVSKVIKDKEGFDTQKTVSDIGYDLGGEDPNSWVNSAATGKFGENGNSNRARFNSNSGINVPLPPGELFYFNSNEFKPSCCEGNVYTSDNGCPCMSKEQIKYLNQRGGNRTCKSDI